ncbi:MAG: HEPN domain-containing protein [Gemmatimonadetes bacterium]|nr:HEPN domain-containing protein [Gemmatimonadota bacterium]
MPRERFLPDDPREWLGRARSNLAQARANTPEVYPEDLCFAAQQAAEKAIKAVMIRHGVRFPYIHDLAALLQLLRGSGLTIPDEVAEAVQLSRYAVLTRYPGDDRVDESDYRAALNIAEAVVQWAEGEVGR